MYSKSHCLLHDCKVEVESVDKGGNFIGQLFTDEGVNVAVALVEAGFAGVYRNASGSQYGALLVAAEQKAKDKKLNVRFIFKP